MQEALLLRVVSFLVSFPCNLLSILRIRSLSSLAPFPLSRGWLVLRSLTRQGHSPAPGFRPPQPSRVLGVPPLLACSWPQPYHSSPSPPVTTTFHFRFSMLRDIRSGKVVPIAGWSSQPRKSSSTPAINLRSPSTQPTSHWEAVGNPDNCPSVTPLRPHRVGNNTASWHLSYKY